MAFILAAQRGGETVVSAFAAYHDYVNSNASRFPKGAYSLASSDWYFDPQDHRCPHDAWLENLAISEPSSGDRNEERVTEVCISLFGAYHDGIIQLSYQNVIRYALSSPSSERGLGDWLYDEFRLHEDGHLIHEIEWAGFPGGEGARWLIESSDVEFQWTPK